MPPSRDVRDPLYLPRAASPAVLTTTVFAGGAPTATQPPQSPSESTPIPIAAIVGGLAAGAFLALAAVGAWICWGRSLERKPRRQPRIRSAMKQQGQGLPGANASKHSLPRTYLASNPRPTLSQKSVAFAPSPRSSEDSDPPATPSPTASPEPSSVDRRKQNPRANREANAPRAPPPPPPPPPPRSSLRPPPSQRPQGTERAYAPARPSPLAHAVQASPSTRSSSMHSASQADSTPFPTASHPPPAFRQLANVSGDRSSAVSSAVTASAPSEYSQEGTASEGGDLPFRMAYVRGGADGRLYAHPEREEPQGSMPHPHLGGPPTSTRIR